ncbi:hypothetical protein CRUP_015824 [Coryphaenoides rupestris]|nr:hypothetical protein CRUP_015824 [Coryphaenoides rupestris]
MKNIAGDYMHTRRGGDEGGPPPTTTTTTATQQQQQQQQPENGFVSPEATGTTTTTTPPTQGLLTRIDQCVLPFLGGFGRYQRQLIVLTWIPALFIGFSQYSDSFLLAQPNNTCCMCKEWTFELQTGLVRNVVTKSLGSPLTG